MKWVFLVVVPVVVGVAAAGRFSFLEAIGLACLLGPGTLLLWALGRHLYAFGDHMRVFNKLRLSDEQGLALGVISHEFEAARGRRASYEERMLLGLLVQAMGDVFAHMVHRGTIDPKQGLVLLTERARQVDAEGAPLFAEAISLAASTGPRDGAASQVRDRVGLLPHESLAFSALNNTWGRLMGGLMPGALRVKLQHHLRGFDSQRCSRIESDWEIARDELCMWATAMLDRDYPDGSKPSAVLRSAKLGETMKRPGDFDLTYAASGKVADIPRSDRR